MKNCPVCKGTGKMNITFSTYGKPGEEKTEINCVHCNGKGTLSDTDAEDLESYLEFQKNAWCKCGNPSGQSKFHPRGNKLCAKHCYTCKDCGKLTQIG